MRRLSLFTSVLVAAMAAAACGESDESSVAPTASIPADLADAEDGTGASTGAEADADADEPVTDPRLGFEGRADLAPTGNRVSTGAGDLDGPSIDVQLESPATWLVPSSPVPGAPWIAVQADGRLVWIDPQSGDIEVLAEAWGDAEPLVRDLGDVETWDLSATIPDALPDGRLVADDRISVVLADPTDRYRHRVLGDEIEAAAIEVRSVDDGDLLSRIELDVDVVEGRSALLGDADGDGVNEILVTQSNGDDGARLVLYGADGEVVAESQPIGRGNRWRNQLAIAPVGPSGEIEIIDVRTPHLGRTLEWFRLDGDDLVRVAFLDGFTSHEIGSRNLDLAIVADADTDGRLEVVAPVPDLTALAVVARTDDGAEVEFTVELGRAMSSNLGAVDHPDGGATYAAGTTDGLVRFWVS